MKHLEFVNALPHLYIDVEKLLLPCPAQPVVVRIELELEDLTVTGPGRDVNPGKHANLMFIKIAQYIIKDYIMYGTLFSITFA